MSKFKALAEEEGVAQRVRFLGWRTDQAALLGACDILAVSAFHEPLGNVILEAWSLGVPVVSAASEGPRWLIEHGTSGLLCEPLNSTDMAAKIREAQDNPAMLKRIAENGYAKWASNFSKDVICRQYVDFFTEIKERGRSPSMPARISRMLKGLALQYRPRPSQKEYRPGVVGA
jgi:glycosyltransferase involved in cell wall biosynthesis